MGFLASLTSFGSTVKHYVDKGVGLAKKTTETLRHGIGQVNSFIDDILDFAHNQPLLIDLANAVENNSIYKGYREITEELDDVLSQADSVFDSISEASAAIERGGAHFDNPIVAPPSRGGEGKPRIPVDPIVRPLPSPDRPVRPLPSPGGPSRPLPALSKF